MAATLLILLGGAMLLVLWMAGGIQRPRSFDQVPERVEVTSAGGLETRSTSTTSEAFTVVVWNIAWGYGFGSEGSGKARPKEHFERSLERIGRTLAGLGADIALLQEIDFDSTRSHRIDQARAIAKIAGLPHVAASTSWIANWIPFPYWPPSEHFGRMRSGGAILSRYPIDSNRIMWLEKPGANPWWWNLFYLFRYLQRCEIRAGDRALRVFNTHLEAFDGANRLLQAEAVRSMLQGSVTSDTLFGGDFNTVPPESTARSGYPDEIEAGATPTRHETDRTLEVFRSLEGLDDVVPAEEFRAHQEQYFTFPAHAPNRKLDYLFAGKGFEIIEARVAREAGDVSDHLPLVVRLRRRPVN